MGCITGNADFIKIKAPIATQIYSQTGFPLSTLHFDSHPLLVVIAQETECISVLA